MTTRSGRRYDSLVVRRKTAWVRCPRGDSGWAGVLAAAAMLMFAAIPNFVSPSSKGGPTQSHPDPLVQEKLEWFQDLKFGLLMHWGPYSQWGVVESWSLCPEDEEWCKRRGSQAQDYFTYKRAYESLKNTFNPVKFDPASWAAAAHEAGMRYVIFTTKHHDGFCMFDTRETDYRVTDSGCRFSSDPRSNIAREIFDAFRRRGFGIGAYFSKPDWHSADYWWPYFPPRDRNVNYSIEKYPEKWEAFRSFTHRQVEELMSGYGRIDILWLDGGWVRPKNAGQDLDMPSLAAKARTLQPGLIIVDRDVEGEFQDYRTPEQQIPDRPPGGVWETCLTMATSWSYVPNDVHKPARMLIQTLVDIVAKGGNLLLNIGPSPEGELPSASLDRLKEIGGWMKVNGEAVYGTRPIAPYRQGRWAFTRGRNGLVHAVYLAEEKEKHIPRKLRIPFFRPGKGSPVTLLGHNKPLAWKTGADGFDILVPASVSAHPPCDHAWVFKFRPE